MVSNPGGPTSSTALLRPWHYAMVFVVTAMVHLPTFAGLDTDFQMYSLFSALLYHGRMPYADYFTMKLPLYYFMLLPGNLVGGRLLSFFGIHLIYVSTLSAVLFHYGCRMGGGRGLLAGYAAWMLYLAMTVFPFMDYGNLNGSIAYAALLYCMPAFFMATSAFQGLADGLRPRMIALAGVLSGAALMTRYGLAPAMVAAAQLAFVLLTRRADAAKVLRAAGIYALGFVAPGLIVLAIIGFPMERMYQYVIVFNRHYSRVEGGPGQYLFSIISRAGDSIWYFMSYTWFIMLPVMAGAAIWLWGMRGRGLRRFVNTELWATRAEGWLVVYMVAEIALVALQGTGPKQYPYFQGMAPLALLGGAAFAFMAGKARKWMPHAAMAAALALAVFFHGAYSVYGIRGNISRVLQWPEGRLAKAIADAAGPDGDVYLLGPMGYLYLESGRLPTDKIPFAFFMQRHWTFMYTDFKLERRMWDTLIANPPRVIVRAVWIEMMPGETALLMNYRPVGTFRTTYRYSGDVRLYVRVP